MCVRVCVCVHGTLLLLPQDSSATLSFAPSPSSTFHTSSILPVANKVVVRHDDEDDDDNDDDIIDCGK